MHLPERVGGYGASFADTSTVLSEFGRAVTSGPLVSSAVIAAGAVTDNSGAANRATTQSFTVQGTTAKVAGPADGDVQFRGTGLADNATLSIACGTATASVVVNQRGVIR